MINPKSLIAAIVAVFFLTACVSSTPYGPVNGGGFGYADQRIQSDKYRVSFRGNAATRRDTVENFLLLRAAEITLANGFDYFVVEENDTEARSYFTSIYGSSFHGGFHNGFGPFYGGRGFGRGFGPGFRADRAFSGGRRRHSRCRENASAYR